MRRAALPHGHVRVAATVTRRCALPAGEAMQRAWSDPLHATESARVVFKMRDSWFGSSRVISRVQVRVHTLPHLYQDWAAHPCHICTGTGLCRAWAVAKPLR